MFVSPSLGVSLLCCLLATVESVHCNPSQEDIESLAHVVCVTTRGTKKQITHIHQIPALVEFFRSITDEHKLFSCRNVYLESIEDLERTVTEFNDDVCGEEKIKLLEDFHRKYVSKMSKHLYKQKRGNKAPKMIKLFFMQFATKISSICEQNAVSFLENHQHPMKDEELGKLNELRKFTDALGMSDLSKGYKGIYLFWSMIDSLGKAAEKKFAKYLTSGPVRLNIQMKDAAPIGYLKALCRFKLRPVYSKSVLPVLRLIDMGYYPESLQLLSDNPKVRPILYATQICETLLPVRVYDDDKLAKDQFVALTVDEAAELESPKEIEGLEMEEVHVKPVTAANLDSLVSSNVAEAQTSLEVIKENIATRSKVVSRMMRSVIKQVKERFGKFGKMLFKRGSNKELEAIDSKELSKIDDEQMLDLPEDTDYGALSSHGGRVKRNCWGGLAFLSLIIVWLIYAAILFLIKLAILGIPSLISYIRNGKLTEKLDYLWKYAYDPSHPVPDGRIERQMNKIHFDNLL